MEARTDIPPRQRWEELRAIDAFLRGRLESTEAVAWALGAKDSRVSAYDVLLQMSRDGTLAGLTTPWPSVWECVIRSLRSVASFDGPYSDVYSIQKILDRPVLPRDLIARIVDAIGPTVEVTPRAPKKAIRKGRGASRVRVIDIISVFISSREHVSGDAVRVEVVKDPVFLTSLALSLESAVDDAVDVIRTVVSAPDQEFRLGKVARVYSVPEGSWVEGGDEPDRYHRGIAPAVKTLCSTVVALGALDVAAAREVLRRWRSKSHWIYRRLWAAIAAQAPIAVSADELADWIRELSEEEFWNANEFPEITELRARRFAELSTQVRGEVESRIRALPPADMWDRKIGSKRINSAREYWAVRELARIVESRGVLGDQSIRFYRDRIANHPDLALGAVAQVGLPMGPRVFSVAREPDPDLDAPLLQLETKIKMLEERLSVSERSFLNDKFAGADAWLDRPENASPILSAYLSGSIDCNAYPVLFGVLIGKSQRTSLGNAVAQDGEGILRTIKMMSFRSLQLCLKEVCSWLDSGAEPGFGHIDLRVRIWVMVWPLACDVEERTNAVVQVSTISDSDDLDSDAVDTINGPIANLMGAAHKILYEVAILPKDSAGASLGLMLQVIADTPPGRARRVALCCLARRLEWMLRHHEAWTREVVVPELSRPSTSSAAMWRALSFGDLGERSLRELESTIRAKLVGEEMDGEPRVRLLQFMTRDWLGRLAHGYVPIVKSADLQQTLRRVDDYSRAQVIRFVRVFVLHNAAENLTRETLFDRSIRSFFSEVWPPDVAARSEAVSAEMVALPALLGRRFADAVGCVVRYIVPFRSWSVSQFGFGMGDAVATDKLAVSESRSAEAMLNLLDVSISSSDERTVPHDLGEALQFLSRVSPGIVNDARFGRLVALSRSG